MLKQAQSTISQKNSPIGKVCVLVTLLHGKDFLSVCHTQSKKVLFFVPIVLLKFTFVCTCNLQL